MNGFLSQCLLTLAAMAPSQQEARERIIMLAAIFIGICFVGGAGILLFRRRLLRKETEGAAAASLFEELRGMRDRGEISPEEFEKTRQAMIRRVRQSADITTKDPASKKK